MTCTWKPGTPVAIAARADAQGASNTSLFHLVVADGAGIRPMHATVWLGAASTPAIQRHGHEGLLWALR